MAEVRTACFYPTTHIRMCSCKWGNKTKICKTILLFPPTRSAVCSPNYTLFTKVQYNNRNNINCCHYYLQFSLQMLMKSFSIYPKSIKFSPPASSARPLFDQSAISSFTSLPKSSCNSPNWSVVLEHTSNHSSTACAFLLGMTARGWGVRLELRPPPAVEAPEVAAGWPASALWKFGMKKALAGWLGNSFIVSEEQRTQKRLRSV